MPQTPGDKIANAGAHLGALFGKAVHSLLIVLVTVGSLSADLLLGPFAMFNFAQEQKVTLLPSITALICSAFSISTSGLQCLLWAKINYDRTTGNGSFRGASAYDKIALIACYMVIIADTLNDLGGMTALMYGPKVGSQIFPKDWQHNPIWITAAILVILICSLSENVIARLLVNEQQRARQADHVMGSFLVEFAIDAMNGIVGMFRFLLNIIARFSIMALDLALSAHFVSATADNSNITHNREFFIVWMPIIISVSLTTVLSLLFMKLGSRVSKTQGFRSLIAQLKENYHLAVSILILLVTDGYLDLGGNTALLYGSSEGLLPDHPAPIFWAITLASMLMCILNEFIFDLVSPKLKKKTSKPKEPKAPKTKRKDKPKKNEKIASSDKDLKDPPEFVPEPVFPVDGDPFSKPGPDSNNTTDPFANFGHGL